jgi:uncharacterized protein (DUF1330 family)
MTAYCLWDVREIHNHDAMNDYVARVTDTVTAFGGEYVVVGGPWQIVEGDWHPAYPVLIEFPSLERAHEWYSSELYAPLRDVRHAASASDAVFFDGTTAATARGLARSADAPLVDVGFDLYRDVHKGIRHGLFHATERAGHIDPLDHVALSEQRNRIERLLHLLDVHAAHEDEYLGPLIERHLPVLAAQLGREHAELDARTAEIRRQLTALGCATGDDRRIAQHRLYLTLSEFTAAYLQHQTTEEVEVLPALNRAAGLEELMEANSALVAAISPGDMDGYMRLIVPAVNPHDLAELYGAMRAGAPDDAFSALLDIARSGLDQHAYDRLTDDLVGA